MDVSPTALANLGYVQPLERKCLQLICAAARASRVQVAPLRSGHSQIAHCWETALSWMGLMGIWRRTYIASVQNFSCGIWPSLSTHGPWLAQSHEGP